MYEVDEYDRAVELCDLPQSSVGAPNPFVLADEHKVVLAYYLEERDPNWDGTTARIVGPTGVDEPIAIVRCNRCSVHMFGPPDDENLSGHPLAKRGLRQYGGFRIDRSSWIRKLERMNAVHSQLLAERFGNLQHLVFTFHDSTFECVCQDFEVTTTRGSIAEAVPEMAKRLGW
jgi:hypothetical protein